MSMRTVFALGLVIACLSNHANGQGMEFNSSMMESTFKIAGPVAPGIESVGTCFVMGKMSTNPNTSGKMFEVLITADHVFSGITGSNATMVLRKQISPGVWQRTNFLVQIR